MMLVLMTVDTHLHNLNSFMSPEQFTSFLNQQTSCQRKVFAHVERHFSGQRVFHLRRFVTGGAGLGKSFLLRMLATFLHLHTFVLPGVKPVKCCAPTGTTARNVHCQTIHSLLRIPVDKYLTYVRLEAYQLKLLRLALSGVHILIIDEVSSQVFTYISKRLTDISGNEHPFGGFNVLLFGDFFQLRPVRGSFIFLKIQCHVVASLFHFFLT